MVQSLSCVKLSHYTSQIKDRGTFFFLQAYIITKPPCFQRSGRSNGTDGTPFKTRDGGILRLEELHRQIVDEVKQKMSENRDYGEAELSEIAEAV